MTLRTERSERSATGKKAFEDAFVCAAVSVLEDGNQFLFTFVNKLTGARAELVRPHSGTYLVGGKYTIEATSV